MEILHALGIQWSLLIAQVINFVILLFILKKFVYTPLLAVIERRQKLTKDSMEKVKEIDTMREKAEQQKDEILKKADQEAGVILERAREQAQASKTEIETAAHKEATEILDKGRKQLENERATVFNDVQQTIAKVIVAASEKILKREFSPEDQKRIMKDLEKTLPSLLS